MKIFLFAALFSLTNAYASPKEIYQNVIKGEAVMIDVRTKEEIADGMIERAHWVPNTQMQSQPDKTTQEVKDLAGKKSIYVYCRSGRRSQMFIDKLEERGVRAENLGGFDDLVKAGLPIKR